jgi:hypothetical protein
LQKSNPHSPWRRLPQRKGADAAFAKAMARAEFGKNYTDDAREAEVRRSLARGKARQAREAAPPKLAPAERDKGGDQEPDGVPGACKPAGTAKFKPWRVIGLREQRQRLATAKARLLNGRQQEDKEPANGTQKT